mmetsp:Transcript_584/g.1121  ORF Transcript_584/g.1121 Transcript_584/m.1121 type:complete len:90 (+) Transcript_584:1015-1284(+)
MIINTEQQVAVMGIDAQTDFDKNKAKYDALVQECQAERSNLAAINADRQHNYEMKKAEAYQALGQGKNTKIIMSGSSGESLISKIFEMD